MTTTGMKQATKAMQGKAKRSNRKGGARKLIAEADRKLANDYSEITERLAEKAREGNAACARLLLSLAEKANRSEARFAPKGGPSLALMWSKEPEWHVEACEADAETNAGSREQED